MKKGNIVHIKVNAKIPPIRDVSYKDVGLEENKIILPAGTELFHVSAEKKLTVFAPVYTCFSLHKPALLGHLYVFRLLQPIKAVQVDDGEVRFNLDGKTDKVEIHYIGTLDRNPRRVLVDGYGRPVHAMIVCRFAPGYAELAAKIKKLDIDGWEKSIASGRLKLIKR